MMTVLIASAVSGAVGLLMGQGTARSTNQVIENLTQENASLHGHVHTFGAVQGIMGVVLVITGTALAGTLMALKRKRG
jgi:hypothetical protein